MTLFITSSPYIDGTAPATLSNANGFIDRIQQVLPPYPQALFITSDPEDRDMTCRFAIETTAAFAEADMPFRGYQILDGFNAEEAGSLIAASDILFLSGGHVPTQNAFFNGIGLRELLEDFPGIIVGISAGSMNSADVVYAQPEEEGESDPEFERFLPGLGLTEINILPHYQKVKDNYLDGLRLYEQITFADSMDHEFFVLPDGSYFYQDDECLLLCGLGYRICNGIMELLNQDDDVLDMSELE